MPQCYLASGDAYTRRYDEVIKDIVRKIKLVDDTLLYDTDIKEAFYHTYDFLTRCAQNRIVLGKDKFQFYKGDTISIQNPNSHRWDIAGRIVETLPNRQCRIRVAGSGRINLL